MPQPLYPDAAARTNRFCTGGGRSSRFSGIGQSQAGSLRRCANAYEVVQEMTLEDHHVYKVRDLNRLRDLLGRCPGAVIVTTEKDAVKLTNRAQDPRRDPAQPYTIYR